MEAEEAAQALEDLAAIQKVEESMAAFSASAPHQNLKNDAPRPRHWEKLMQVTEVA